MGSAPFRVACLEPTSRSAVAVAAVEAVVLASSGSSVRDKLPPHLAELAEAMVAEGRGLDLLPWGTGENYASTVSAEYFVARSVLREELYGTAEVPPAIARVRCPVIGWFGGLEDRPRRRVGEFLDWLAGNAVKAANVDLYLIDDVDFFYAGREEVVVRHLAASLRRIGLAPGPPARPRTPTMPPAWTARLPSSARSRNSRGCPDRRGGRASMPDRTGVRAAVRSGVWPWRLPVISRTCSAAQAEMRSRCPAPR